MKKTIKKFALVLSALLIINPLLFAVDSKLNKEIAALELELTQMKTKTGEYADMKEAELTKKIAKTEKELKSKKEKAKEEAKKDAEKIKKAAKKTGKDLKKAGKDIGDAFKDIFN